MVSAQYHGLVSETVSLINPRTDPQYSVTRSPSAFALNGISIPAPFGYSPFSISRLVFGLPISPSTQRVPPSPQVGSQTYLVLRILGISTPPDARLLMKRLRSATVLPILLTASGTGSKS